MTFYKMQGNSFDFGLKDLEVKEEYSVWNNTIQQFLREDDDKVIVGTDNKEYKIGETKFMKAARFKMLFPACAKNRQHIRNILLYSENGVEEYWFGFKQTANEKLMACIDTLQKAKQNPLSYYFTLRKNGVGLDTTYEVITGDLVKVTTHEDQTQSHPPQPTRKVGSAFIVPKKFEMQNYIELTKDEQEILDDAEYYPERLSEEQFVTGFKHSLMKFKGIKIDDARAKDIYQQHYVKS